MAHKELKFSQDIASFTSALLLLQVSLYYGALIRKCKVAIPTTRKAKWHNSHLEGPCRPLLTEMAIFPVQILEEEEEEEEEGSQRDLERRRRDT